MRCRCKSGRWLKRQYGYYSRHTVFYYAESRESESRRMKDLAVKTGYELPVNIEDLGKFVLIGREKLVAVRAEIRAIDKVGLAQEVRKQKLEEAQYISEAVLDAEVRIGELMKDLPKATTNHKNKNLENDSGVDFLNTKTQKIKDAGFTLKQAERFQQLASNPELVEKAKAEARANDDIVSRSQVLNMIKEQRRKDATEAKRERKKYELAEEMPDDVCKLFIGDIRDGLKEVDDESIDFIVTDPPYPKEYLPLYSDLSRLASRVLKPGGSLIAMIGQSYLPEVVQRLSENMSYYWIMPYLTPGGGAPLLYQKRVNTFWKPVLWYVKGEYKGDYIGDILKSPESDKRFHEWGQSLGGMIDIIERLTNPGDVILDPFLGGGTTGVAAVIKGRKFIGSDIDLKNIDISIDRIKEVYSNVINKRKNRVA